MSELPDFLKDIDNSWTLFLDRDGVLNIEKANDYIRSQEEFVFYEDTLAALKILSAYFHKIIIVTNQRGIGRGLMTHDDLSSIHHFMLDEIAKSGGGIDAIFYAPDIDKEAPNRKPNVGMGLQAKEKFPSIDFSKSIMVGNNISDMEFGRALKMKTVYVETTKPLVELHDAIDVKTKNLFSFAESVVSSMDAQKK